VDKKQFISRFKKIYNSTKRGPHDSPYKSLLNMFLGKVIAKSNAEWDENVAQQVMSYVEHVFNYQPEETQSAKRFTSDNAETKLAEFLQERGYSYTHIPESHERSPDGYIEGSDSKYICELKSPILMFDHNEAPFGYKHSTTHRKILDAIHEGKKQLEKLDPDHSLPHILIYTSAHPQLNYTNFRDAIRGYLAMQDGAIMTDLRDREIYLNTRDIIEDIDLYIWMQMGANAFHQVAYFCNSNSKHKNLIHKLVRKLESESVKNGSTAVSLQSLLVTAP